MSTKSNLNKRTFINSALLMGVASSFSAGAADDVKTLEKTKAQAEEQETYKIEKSSTHKIATDLVDTPKTINTIDAAVLADQGVTSLNDALRNVAGVSTFGAGEGGGGNVTTNDKITIRGFNANGNIYIDGVRDLSGYSRDLFNSEQVEVAKGASSSISGKGTSGGAVNLVTKQAKQDTFSNVNVSYDDAETIRVTVDANRSISDTSAFRVNALYTDGGDPLGNGIEEYKTVAVAPAISIDFSRDLSLTADALIMSQDNNPVLGLPYVSSAVAEQLGLKEGPIDKKYWGNYYGVSSRDFEEVDVTILTAKLEYQLAENMKLINQMRFGKNEKKSVTARPMFRSVRDPETRERTYFNDISITSTSAKDEENEVFVNQLDAVINLTGDVIKNDLIVGFEYYSEEKTAQRLANRIELETDYVSLDNPITNMPYTGNIEIDGEPSVTEGEGVALYFLNNITIDENWLLTAGLRYEDYEATGARYMWKRVNGSWEREYASGLKSSGDFISWNVSAGYKPSEDSFVYVAVANSQDPAAGDLAFSWSQAAVDQIGALDPQEAKNYEVGGKVELFDRQLQLTAAYFNTTKTVTDRDENGTYFLAGEQEAKGFEFSASGKIADDLDIIATYTKQDTEVTKDFDEDSIGDGLSAAPENMASLWLNYTMDAFKFGIGAQYSSGDTYWRRQMAYYESGNYTLVQAMVGYDVNDSLTVQLNVDNLTDKDRVTDYSARGHFKPGDPRVVKLSASYKF